MAHLREAASSYRLIIFLTAAHVVCATGQVTPLPPSSLKVSVGYTNLNNDYNRRYVQNVVVNSQYSRIFQASLGDYVPINDIALITLSSPLTFGTNIQPVEISSNSFYPSGTQAIVSGWGSQNNYDAPNLSQLYKANVTVSSCTSENIIAAASTSSAYHGDSGGPLTIVSNGNEVLIGLVSYGSSPFSASQPSYYTNVGSYYDWILSNVVSLSAPSTICTTATAQILNFPTGCTVNWSVSSNCTQIVSGQGTSSVTLQRNYDGVATLTAAISYNGSVVKTLSQDIMVGSPPFCMSIMPVAANGGWGYWRSDMSGNTMSIEYLAGVHYPSYEVDLYKMNSNFSLGPRVGHWVTSNLSNMTFGYYPQGWYSLQVVGVNDCGSSYAVSTQFECRSGGGGGGPSPMFSFSYSQDSELLTVRRIPATGQERGLSERQSALEGICEIQLWNGNSMLRSIKSNDEHIQIPMSGMKAGLYVVRAIINGLSQQQKLLKK